MAIAEEKLEAFDEIDYVLSIDNIQELTKNKAKKNSNSNPFLLLLLKTVVHWRCCDRRFSLNSRFTKTCCLTHPREPFAWPSI